MDARRTKDDLYEQFARIGQVLSHPKRVELLDLLSQSSRGVDDLAKLTGMSMTSASAQLQILKRARVVNTRRDGKRIIYSVADASVSALIEALQGTAEARLAEVAEILRNEFDTAGLEAIAQAELAERLEDPDVVIIDVRPPEEFAAGHIEGAISMPIGEIEARLRDIPRRSEVIAYCRGPYCILAPQAVEAIRAAGHSRVRRLASGFPQWRAADLPVAAGHDGSAG